jgi:hypothetical protein
VKIEQLVVQHFYNNKELGLQGFGTFKLKPREDISHNENEQESPLQAEKDIIEFTFDPKTTADHALLLYIVQQTGKMKALAAADIESYLVLAKQFLNIGKPFPIEGIGVLQKSQQGNYTFIQGAFVAPRVEEQSKPLKEKQEEPISFKQEIHSIITKRNIQIAAILLLVVAFGITLAFILVGKKDESAPAPVASIVAAPSPVIDTTTKTIDSSNNIKKDTVVTAVTIPPAPLAPVLPLGLHDSNVHFEVIIKTYPTLDSVQNSYRKIRADGYKVNIHSYGSQYTLGLPCKNPLADSTKMLDSIHMVFGGATRIQLP